MTLLEFAAVMERKLDENDHKEHWSNFPISHLSRRLSQELEELRRAIKKNLPPEDIVREAADVANFAMMIADNYEAAYEEGKP